MPKGKDGLHTNGKIPLRSLCDTRSCRELVPTSPQQAIATHYDELCLMNAAK